MVSLLTNVMQVIRERAAVRARGRRIRIMACANAYSRHGLFTRDLPARLLFQYLFVFARRPSIANVRGSDAIRIAMGTRAVFRINFRPSVSHLIRVRPFQDLYQPRSAQSSATYDGHARAVNTSSVRLLTMEYHVYVTVHPSGSSDRATNCKLILVSLPNVARIAIRLRGLYREGARRFLISLTRLLSRGAVGAKDCIANKDGHDLPPSEVARSTRDHIVGDVNVFRYQGGLVLRAAMRNFILVDGFLGNLHYILRRVRDRPREYRTIAASANQLGIVDNVSSRHR